MGRKVEDDQQLARLVLDRELVQAREPEENRNSAESGVRFAVATGAMRLAMPRQCGMGVCGTAHPVLRWSP